MKSKNYILGFDPGFGGAYAIYDISKKNILWVKDMPLTKSKVKNKKFDIDIPKLVLDIKPYKDNIKMAIIEKVGPAPHDISINAFRFGEGFGILQGVLITLGVIVAFVEPGVWKNSMGLDRNKKKSIRMAARLFPEIKNKLTKTIHNGRAEACLIAYLGRTFM